MKLRNIMLIAVAAVLAGCGKNEQSGQPAAADQPAATTNNATPAGTNSAAGAPANTNSSAAGK
jgi:PBP1b-binding outer membrane lipoprotein LpoB